MKHDRDNLPKLVAVDLDGTLLTSEGTLAYRGTQLLKTVVQNGVHVVLASARFPASMKDYCQLLDIAGPMICMNGAQVYASPDGPVLASLTFPKEIGLEIATLADMNGWEISITVGSVTYYRQRPGQILGSISEGRIVVASSTDAIIDNPARILTHGPEAIEALGIMVESKYSDSCCIDAYQDEDGSIYSLGIFPKGANKGDALDLILRYLRIDRKDALAIGDNVNDILMFERAQISIAMANAPEHVKHMATHVVPSNDDEGVAWALEAFCISS